MIDPTESVLYNTAQALLKQMNSQRYSQKGTSRWSLHMTLESDPSCTVSLIRMLIGELEETLYKNRSHMHIIPGLHTLYYVIVQSGVMIPTSLYQIVNEGLMKLLTLPSPYSAVALSILRSIKMEMITPGFLYQRKVVAEQNLRTQHFTLQEKVFVLADPAVFSAPLEETVKVLLEVPGPLRNTKTVEKDVLQHVMQRGLGKMCQSSILAQALEDLGDELVEKYFQEVILIMEENIKHGAGAHSNYLDKLQDIHRAIVTTSKEELTTVDDGSVCRTALPYPEINFMLWKYEDDLWDLLASFHRYGSYSSADHMKDKGHSIQQEDGSLERHLRESLDLDDKEPAVRGHEATLSRRKALKNMKAADKLSLVTEKIEALPGNFPFLREDNGRHTARVVVMGDDRVLGRLSRAYHNIRKRESKRLNLTKKVNLHLYYIPFTDVEPSISPPDSSCHNEQRLSVASLLGRVDPWYNSNINSLHAAISKQAGKHPAQTQPSQQSLFLLDSLCYYLRCGTQPVNLPLYSVKMWCSSCDVKSVVEDVFVSHLEADISEFRHLKERSSQMTSCPRRKKLVGEIFGAVISVSYTKMSLSKREVVKGEAPMTYGLVITSELAAEKSGEDCLTVSFNSVNPEHNTKIQTRKISIKTMEHRTLSVCLDKDSRRTFTDVLRMEVSPCLDPGFNIRPKSKVISERELLLSKYLDKVVSLPINTFTGVSL